MPAQYIPRPMGFWPWLGRRVALVCSHGGEHRGTPVTCSAHLWSVLPVFLARNAGRRVALLRTPERKKRASSPATLGPTGARKETRGRCLGGGARRHVLPAAIVPTLLWVKGHQPEKKPVYHVGNSCHP